MNSCYFNWASFCNIVANKINLNLQGCMLIQHKYFYVQLQIRELYSDYIKKIKRTFIRFWRLPRLLLCVGLIMFSGFIVIVEICSNRLLSRIARNRHATPPSQDTLCFYRRNFSVQSIGLKLSCHIGRRMESRATIVSECWGYFLI